MLLNRLGPKYFHPFSHWIWPFPQDCFKFYDEPLCLDTSDFLGTSTLTFGGAILSNGENLEIAEMLNLTSKDCTLFKPIIIPQPFWLCTSSAKIKMRYALKVHFWMFSHFWMVRCFLLSHFFGGMFWCFHIFGCLDVFYFHIILPINNLNLNQLQHYSPIPKTCRFNKVYKFS